MCFTTDYVSCFLDKYRSLSSHNSSLPPPRLSGEMLSSPESSLSPPPLTGFTRSMPSALTPSASAS